MTCLLRLTSVAPFLLLVRVLRVLRAPERYTILPQLSELLLEASGISKTFAGVRALHGVSFDLRAGEVHALVGENGAGKSTLTKIMTGAETADSGVLAVSGRGVQHMDPATARSLGIAAIYQHPSLFPDLTVTENIALSLDRGRGLRRVHWTACRQTAVQLLEQVGAEVNPDRLVATLSMPERQLVEIAKAIGANGRILIMDEPTASLTEREIANLLHVAARLCAHGAGVIYISHKLEEIFAVADRITVLRDGESIATRRRDEINSSELVRLMVGRELTAMYPKRAAALGAQRGALEMTQQRAPDGRIVEGLGQHVRLGRTVPVAHLHQR